MAPACQIESQIKLAVNSQRLRSEIKGNTHAELKRNQQGTDVLKTKRS